MCTVPLLPCGLLMCLPYIHHEFVSLILFFSQPHCCRMDEGQPSVNTRLGQSTVHGLDYGLWTMDGFSEQIWIQTTPTSYYDLLPRPLLEIILSHAHFLVSSGCSQNIHPVRICMHTYSIITLLCLGLIVG